MTSNVNFNPATAAPFICSLGHPGWLGLAYAGHSAEWVELKLPWREDLLGDDHRRVLASGPILSLMDVTSGMAVWHKIDEFRAIATLDLRVDYVRPAKEGASVFGRAECYRVTRSAYFVRGLAHDGDADDPVAHIQAVFMKIDVEEMRTLPNG